MFLHKSTNVWVYRDFEYNFEFPSWQRRPLVSLVWSFNHPSKRRTSFGLWCNVTHFLADLWMFPICQPFMVPRKALATGSSRRNHVGKLSCRGKRDTSFVFSKLECLEQTWIYLKPYSYLDLIKWHGECLKAPTKNREQTVAFFSPVSQIQTTGHSKVKQCSRGLSL